MLTANEIRTARRWARRKLLPLGMTVVAPATIALLVLSACGDDEKAADASASQTLAGTSWTLASVTAAGKTVDAAPEATLAFDAAGTNVSGSTGCNQYSGTYVQTGSDVKISPGPTTLAACGDPAKTVQEAAILAGLPKVASFALGTQLVLKDSGGSTLFTYDKGTSSLEGTSWKATGINNGKNAGGEHDADRDGDRRLRRRWRLVGQLRLQHLQRHLHLVRNQRRRHHRRGDHQEGLRGRRDGGRGPVPGRAGQGRDIHDLREHADAPGFGWQHADHLHAGHLTLTWEW